MRIIRRQVSVVAAVLALVLGGATSAGAIGIGSGDDGGSSGSTGDATGTAGGYGDEGTTHQENAGGCHVVSTPQSLGAYCPGGNSQGIKSIKQIMGGEKFKECWMTPMTDAEQEAYGYAPNGDAKPYVRHCIKGIDPKTLDITGAISVEDNPVYLYPPYTHEEIGPNQSSLLELYQSPIPYPIAGVSPSGRPRVHQWVSFYDAQLQDQVAGSTDHEIVVPTLGIRLIAEEDKIVVQPRGMNIKDSITCPNGGHQAVQGEEGVEGGNCWYRYKRSSAGQPNNNYPVRITSYWSVYIEEGGQRRLINNFRKSVTTPVPVTEIQAITVS